MHIKSQVSEYFQGTKPLTLLASYTMLTHFMLIGKCLLYFMVVTKNKLAAMFTALSLGQDKMI